MNNYTSPHKLRVPRLSDLKPTIIVDSREQEPLPLSRLQAVRGTLTTGDYSVVGLEQLFSIERKSISDLVGCCMGDQRQRFGRELCRLRGCRFRRLLIVGTEEDILQANYRSAIKPQAVIATLCAFEARYDLPVVYKATPKLAARQIESWAWWFARECLLSAINLTKTQANTKEAPQ